MPTITTIRHLLLLVMVMATVTAASATGPYPKNSSGKDSVKSSVALRGNWGYHQDVFDSRTLSDAVSDRAQLSDYIVSLHVFLPTILPLLDDQSKKIFERAVIEFVISNIGDETLPIESIGNILITDQELAWSSVLDGLSTPGIEVFFRADASVTGGVSQQEVEKSIQSVFDSKSTMFHEVFSNANGGPIDQTSTPSLAPSIGLLELSTKPTALAAEISLPSTQPTGLSTATASPALTVGTPGPTKPPIPLTQISDPSAKVPNQSTGVEGSSSILLLIGAISAIVGSMSFIGIILLCARCVRKRMNNNSDDEKAPLETTLQTEDNEGKSNQSESSIAQGENHYIQRAFSIEQQHSDDSELIVSDNESEFKDPHNFLTLSALAKDSIDMSTFFQCDESAVMSSIASSTNTSDSDGSYNHSQTSTITVEDLENFDNELRQSEC